MYLPYGSFTSNHRLSLLQKLHHICKFSASFFPKRSDISVRGNKGSCLEDVEKFNARRRNQEIHVKHLPGGTMSPERRHLEIWIEQRNLSIILAKVRSRDVVWR